MVTKGSDLTKVDRFNLFGGEGNALTTPFMSIEDFHGKGRLFGTMTLAPGHSVGNHKHENEQELYYILEGQGVYNNNGEDVVVNPGDVTHCKNGESHGIVNNGTEPLVFIALILFVD